MNPISTVWISVKDKLPPSGKTVVVIHHDYKEMEADLAEWNEEGNYWLRSNDDQWNKRTETVSYWLPLPDAT